MQPAEVYTALEGDLPPAVLLLGPRLNDTGYLSRKVLLNHRVHPADLAHIRRLTADYSRDLVAFAGTAPYGPYKAVVVCTDGASEQAQNILLKTLEEPPESLRFILYGTTEPLPAVVSRCQVFRLGSSERQEPEPGSAQGKVAAAVRAAKSSNPVLLAEALRAWDDDAHAALSVWALGEAARSAERARPALRVLEVLTRYPRARPVNAAAAALSLAYAEES